MTGWAIRGIFSCWLVANVGCGTGWLDDSSGGPGGLPTAGGGPFGRLPIDLQTPANEPIIVENRQANLTAPFVHTDADGLVVYMGYRTLSAPEVGEIRRSRMASVFDRPLQDPQTVLIASEPWEDGIVASPTMVQVGARWFLYYQGGDDAIGRAVSDDGGETWTKDPQAPVLTGAKLPSVAFVDGIWYLYFVATGAQEISLATSDDGINFVVADEPVLSPRGLAQTFDRDAVTSPQVAVRQKSDGSFAWRMAFTGIIGDVRAIGTAGSFDGRTWQLYNFGEAALDAEEPSEDGGHILLDGDRAYLFFHEARSTTQILGAIE